MRSALSLSQERSRATFSGLVKLGIASIDDRAVEVLVWSLTEDSNRTPSIQDLPIASAAGLLANRPLLREDFDLIMAVIGQHAGRCTSYDNTISLGGFSWASCLSRRFVLVWKLGGTPGRR